MAEFGSLPVSSNAASVISPLIFSLGAIALASENSVTHFLCLFLHSILSQGLRGFAHEVKDIAISLYEGTIRLDLLRLRFCFLNLHKTAETIGNVVGQPGAAEGGMGSQPPYGKLSHIQLHIFLEGKQQARQPIMPEGIGFLEFGALFEDAFFGEDLIDTVHPLL